MVVDEVHRLGALILHMHQASLFWAFGLCTGCAWCWGDVACSAPLESAPGCHLTYFPHLLTLLILYPLYRISLWSSGSIQVTILDLTP
jgi:hypothetical protein